jgi:hypothetical protein
MKSKEKNDVQHELSPDETLRISQYLESQTERLEVIGMLDNYSGRFADWSITISEAVHEAKAKKQQSGVDCEKERKMLDNLSYLFTKLAYHSGMLSEWHKELAVRVKNTEKMVE